MSLSFPYRLVKEQEQFQQKKHSLQNEIVKLKEELEFLQLEVQSKDKEIEEYVFVCLITTKKHFVVLISLLICLLFACHFIAFDCIK